LSNNETAKQKEEEVGFIKYLKKNLLKYKLKNKKKFLIKSSKI
jgi:hypothetical protein